MLKEEVLCTECRQQVLVKDLIPINSKKEYEGCCYYGHTIDKKRLKNKDYVVIK